jgi:hypothetical protein
MANDPNAILTPECDKLSKVFELSNNIGAFLDWLGEQGIVLGKHHEHTDSCRGEDGFIGCGCRNGDIVLINESFEKLLARYFDIDLKKVEEERRAILDAFRKQTEAKSGGG